MDVRSWSLRCYRGKRGRRWFVDVLTDGKRIRAVIRQAKTKEEALELAPKIVEDIRRGNTPGDGSSPSVMEGSITLAGALEADNSRTGIAERTRQSEVNQAGHLSRILGAGKALLSLSHDDIETYKKHRQGDGVKPRTINLELQLLRAMLNRLLKANKISRVPVSISNLPEDDDGKVTKTLTKEERDLLIAECKSTPGLYDQVAFLVHTGLRRDELFSLRWGSVRLGAPRPSVTIAWKKRGAAGNYRTRVVPLNTVAAEIIERRGQGESRKEAG
jgi:integrase